MRAGKFSRALRARGEVSAMDLKKEFLVRGVKIEKSQLLFFCRRYRMFLFLHHVAKSAISPKVRGGTFFLGGRVVPNDIDVNSTLLLHSYEKHTPVTYIPWKVRTKKVALSIPSFLTG